MAKSMVIVVSDEAAHAIRCQGPTRGQLLKALNGSTVDTIPDSRHIRWMAAKLLQVLWDELPEKVLKVARA